MPDKTVHTLEATNGTKIIIPKSIKMDGKLRRDKTTNRIKLSYKFKMSRPDYLKVDYVYLPTINQIFDNKKYPKIRRCFNKIFHALKHLLI